MLDWASLEPARVERAAAGLVQAYTKGTAIPIDGAGGDDAQDLRQAHGDGSITIYEIKSFTGRLNRSRERQIVESFMRAVKLHRPRTWVLVVPIDPTPREERWLAGLRPERGRPPKIVWWGKTWLDMQIAHDPAWRFYVEGAAAELLERAGEHFRETMVSTGGQLFARQVALMRRGDELSPYWRWKVSEGPNGSIVRTLEARRLDAAEKDPVSLNVTFSFHQGDPRADLVKASFLDVIAYGGSVEVPGEFIAAIDTTVASEATGRLLDIGEEEQTEKFVIESIPDMTGLPRAATLVALNDTGERAEIPITLIDRVGGQQGQTLRGRDALGLVEVRIIRNFDEVGAGPGRLTVTTDTRGCFAHEAVPILKWLTVMDTGGTTSIMLGPVEITRCDPEQPRAVTHLTQYRYARALEIIGTAIGRAFRLPEEVSNENVSAALKAAAALSGQRAPLPYTGVEREFPEADRARVLAFPSEGAHVVAGMPWTVTIGEDVVTLDNLAAYAEATTLANRDDIASGSTRTAILECLQGATMWLIKAPELMPAGTMTIGGED